MNRTRLTLVTMASAAFAMLGASAQAQTISDTFTFSINPSQSSADMTIWGLFNGQFGTSADIQNFPVAGTITLDIDADLGAGVVNSVSFVSMVLEYETDPDDPTNFSVTQLIPSPFTGLGDGASAQFRLPFEPAVAAGNNPPTQSEPLLVTLNAPNAGTPSGSGGSLTLTGPTFESTGLAQNFGFTPFQPQPGVDGFPINLAWTGNGDANLNPAGVPGEVTVVDLNVLEVAFSAFFIGDGEDLQPLLDGLGVATEQEALDALIGFGLIPPGTTSVFADVAQDASATTLPLPTDPIQFDLDVSISGNSFLLNGDYFTFGEGGVSQVAFGAIHNASFQGVAAVPEPASIAVFAAGMTGLSVLRREVTGVLGCYRRRSKR